MTALLDRVQESNGDDGGFSPFVGSNDLLRLPAFACNEYRVEGNVFVHFRSHHVRSCRICSCKHMFIKLHQVTNAQESVLHRFGATHLKILNVILHEFCTRICPELQNPMLGKAEKNLLPKRRCPSGRMRGGETHGFQALTHRPRRSPLSRRARVHGSIMDSATPP